MGPDGQRFGMRWSRLTWVVTVAMIVLVVAVAVVILWKAIHVGPDAGGIRVLLVLLGFLPAICLAILASFAPRAYEVDPDAIVVKRIVGNVVIRRANVREIRRIESREVGSALRLFACGGFFGWFGLFYSHQIGRFWAYTGNQADMVLITQADGTKIVISPYPPDAFLEAIRETEPRQD